MTSRKFHNYPGTKQMTDSNRLTLVLIKGKSINIANLELLFENCDCLRVPHASEFIIIFLHSKPKFIPSAAF